MIGRQQNRTFLLKNRRIADTDLPAINADGQPGVQFDQAVKHGGQIKVFTNGKRQVRESIYRLTKMQMVISKGQKGFETFFDDAPYGSPNGASQAVLHQGWEEGQ